MKGIVFNLLETVVSEEEGAAAWDEALRDSGVDGAFSSLGTYDHSELHALAEALAPRLGMSPDEVVRWFGRRALRKLAAIYPKLFLPHASLLPFLETLNAVIHPEVRKLYPGAEVPVFDYRVAGPDRMVMGYNSSRGLCWFGHGLIEGASDHYSQEVDVAQTSCVQWGDGECVFDVVVP